MLMVDSIVGCVEQRLTGFTVGLLVGLSATAVTRLLVHIPMGAVYGALLYMGLMGLHDLVLVRRVLALLRHPKSWKDHECIRHLPTMQMATFIGIQLSVIGFLVGLICCTEFTRVGTTAMVFPVILLLFALLREYGLPHWSLLRPHLEQMDPLHKVRLPTLKHYSICCALHTTYVTVSSYDEDILLPVGRSQHKDTDHTQVVFANASSKSSPVQMATMKHDTSNFALIARPPTKYWTWPFRFNRFVDSDNTIAQHAYTGFPIRSDWTKTSPSMYNSVSFDRFHSVSLPPSIYVDRNQHTYHEHHASCYIPTSDSYSMDDISENEPDQMDNPCWMG